MTQAKLAREIGVSRPSLANMERGKQVIALHLVYGLVEALDLSALTDLVPLRPLSGRLEGVGDREAGLNVHSEHELSDDLAEEALRLRLRMTS